MAYLYSLKKLTGMLTALLLCICANAQTITPQVINSAGDHRQVGNTGVYITDNVGEPFTQTVGNGSMVITQGFIQPGPVSPGGFTPNVLYQSPQCIEKSDDSFISVELSSPVSNYSAKYLWSPAGVCPNKDCSKLKALKPGIYSVTVVVSYNNGLGALVLDSLKLNPVVLTKALNPCKVGVYSGVTANNDGFNDVWTIDNIEDYPNNRVTIYNRWGEQMFDIKGYNNRDRVWPTQGMLDLLTSSTYFYVIELGDGSQPIKGWVELIKNQ